MKDIMDAEALGWEALGYARGRADERERAIEGTGPESDGAVLFAGAFRDAAVRCNAGEAAWRPSVDLAFANWESSGGTSVLEAGAAGGDFRAAAIRALIARAERAKAQSPKWGACYYTLARALRELRGALQHAENGE